MIIHVNMEQRVGRTFLSAFGASQALVQTGKPATLWANNGKLLPTIANNRKPLIPHRRDGITAEKAE